MLKLMTFLYFIFLIEWFKTVKNTQLIFTDQLFIYVFVILTDIPKLVSEAIRPSPQKKTE